MQVVDPAHGAVRRSQDDVALAEARAPRPGCSSRSTRRARRTRRRLVGARQRARDRRLLAGHADVAAADAAVAHQARRDEPDGIAGNREADALRRQDHRGVDADDLAGRRDERPAGVAGVERRVGLDDVVHQPSRSRAQRSAERADDAGRDGMVEAVRIADGDRDLTRRGRASNRRAGPTAGASRRPAGRRDRCRRRAPIRSARDANGRPAAARRSPIRASTTWLLVRTKPSGVKTTPEPPPRRRIDPDDRGADRFDGLDDGRGIGIEQLCIP